MKFHGVKNIEKKKDYIKIFILYIFSFSFYFYHFIFCTSEHSILDLLMTCS